MDTKKVRALLTIIEKGSLTAASEELGYTQPGLTNMMRSLEDEMGLTLLVRGKTGVRLSPIGSELRADMEALVEATDNLYRDAENIRKKHQSTFRVGAIASVARNWLPQILAEFKTEFPDTGIFVTHHDVLRTTYEAVRSGELDCALISYQEELATGLVWNPLHDDELVAVLPINFEVNDNVFRAEDFYYTDFLMPSGGIDVDIMPIFDTGASRKLPNIHYSNLDDASNPLDG
jgi:Transcriptional regulator